MPEAVTMERALHILRAIIGSANSQGCAPDKTVVTRQAVLDAEQFYRDATGIFINVG